MLIVQKYGGTSVGSVDRIKAVASRILRTQRAGHQVVVIASAMAGETNRLLGMADKIGATDPREMDVLLASGEQVSIALVAQAIKAIGGEAVSLLGHQVRMLTDAGYSRARIRTVDAPRLHRALSAAQIPVVAGFQGVDDEGNITTLGRGGSDTSAVAIAASLKADLCEIYTDVDGVYTADPGICPEARPIQRITYDEMMELASLGAKVLQIRSVEVAHKYRVPLHVRSSFSEEEGTMVVAEEESLERIVVTGVSLDRDQCRLTVRGLPWRPGIQAELFRAIGRAGVVVDMIVQNPPLNNTTNVSFTVHSADLGATRQSLAEELESLGEVDVVSDDAVAKVSIVGLGMRSHAGVAHRMFELLAAEAIEILMISTSEIKVSCIIPRTQADTAVKLLHRGFIGT